MLVALEYEGFLYTDPCRTVHFVSTLDVNCRHTHLAVVNILLLFSPFCSFPLVPFVPLWPIVALQYV